MRVITHTSVCIRIITSLTFFYKIENIFSRNYPSSHTNPSTIPGCKPGGGVSHSIIGKLSGHARPSTAHQYQRPWARFNERVTKQPCAYYLLHSENEVYSYVLQNKGKTKYSCLAMLLIVLPVSISTCSTFCKASLYNSTVIRVVNLWPRKFSPRKLERFSSRKPWKTGTTAASITIRKTK